MLRIAGAPCSRHMDYAATRGSKNYVNHTKNAPTASSPSNPNKFTPRAQQSTTQKDNITYFTLRFQHFTLPFVHLNGAPPEIDAKIHPQTFVYQHKQHLFVHHAETKLQINMAHKQTLRPKLLRCDASTFSKVCELRPHDARVNFLLSGGKRSKSAIAAPHHIFAAYDICKSDQSLSY